MQKKIKASIIGCANAGKSTLINRLSNQKVSITSPIPQTTRNSIPTLIKTNKSSLLIFDTPGYLKPKNKLDLFLNSEIINQIKSSKLIIFVIDATNDFTEQHEKICKLINETHNTYVFVVFSKIDLIKNEKTFENIKNKIESLLIKIDKKFFKNLQTDDLTNLMNEIENLCSYDNNDYENYINQDLQDDLYITEIIREQIIKYTFFEIPHSCAVIIENKKYDSTKNIFFIECAIIVEKDSQKRIIIGKNASKIKQINIAARKELNNIYDCKINLKLFCKVEKKWRNNNYLIKSFGYKKWH